MEWQHQVSERWLAARREVITATELIKLIPSLKKWQKDRTTIPPMVAELWAEKHSSDELETWSYGAAARGHIMEPYAVQTYDSESLGGMPPMYHWDDMLITNGVVGFSPDAMNVEQPGYDDVVLRVRGKHLEGANSRCELPTSILEVKSYGTRAHMKAVITDKMELDERYQVAAAMLVCPSIRMAEILFWAPQCSVWYAVKHYENIELDAEIHALEEALSMWQHCCRKLDSTWELKRCPVSEHDVQADLHAELNENIKKLWIGGAHGRS